jgi:hypothetical protein
VRGRRGGVTVRGRFGWAVGLVRSGPERFRWPFSVFILFSPFFLFSNSFITIA